MSCTRKNNGANQAHADRSFNIDNFQVIWPLEYDTQIYFGY